MLSPFSVMMIPRIPRKRLDSVHSFSQIFHKNSCSLMLKTYLINAIVLSHPSSILLLFPLQLKPLDPFSENSVVTVFEVSPTFFPCAFTSSQPKNKSAAFQKRNCHAKRSAPSSRKKEERHRKNHVVLSTPHPLFNLKYPGGPVLALIMRMRPGQWVKGRCKR